METKDWQNLKKLVIRAVVILAPVTFSPAQQLGHLDLIFRILHIYVASLQMKVFLSQP